MRSLFGDLCRAGATSPNGAGGSRAEAWLVERDLALAPLRRPTAASAGPILLRSTLRPGILDAAPAWLTLPGFGWENRAGDGGRDAVPAWPTPLLIRSSDRAAEWARDTEPERGIDSLRSLSLALTLGDPEAFREGVAFLVDLDTLSSSSEV